MILNYHCIHSVNSSNVGYVNKEWSIDVNRFITQINVLSRLGDFVCMDRILRNHGNSNRMIHLTFDDGYRGVVEHVLPVLRERNIPATLFINGYYVLTRNLPWWDLVSYMANNYSGIITLPLRTSPRKFVLPLERDSFHSRVAYAMKNGTLDNRKKLYHKIYYTLLKTSDVPSNNIINTDELIKVRKCDLTRIGCHTFRHINTRHNKVDTNIADISKNRSFFKLFLGREPRYFAFPYGGKKEVDISLVHFLSTLNFEAAFLTSAVEEADSLRVPCIRRLNVSSKWSLPRFCFEVCRELL